MKRFTSGILIIAIVLCVLVFIPTKVEAATSGITGSCTWSLDGTVLTISGSGQMASYYTNGYLTTAPWGDEVTQVIIENGVTNVGQYAFYGCKNLQSASLPSSVRTVDTQAFDRSGIKSISLSDGLTTIYDGAFNSCTSLYNIVLPSSLTYIGDYAFQSCQMTDIVFSTNLKHIGRSAFNYCSITDVWYLGDYNDKAGMTINGYNACLNTAIWHYNSCPIDAHSYDNICDINCNYCEYIRTGPGHIFDNICDIECNVCGFPRTVPDHNYTINGNYSCSICKYSKVPDVPVIEKKTYNSITLVPVDGFEYSIDGVTWQTSNVFTDLSADTIYSFYQRVKASDLAMVSATSGALAVKTDEEPVYNVIFRNWDGSEISVNTYHYGDEVTAPANPQKAADNTYTYTFAGWDKEIVNCAGNATYTATYTSTYKDYTVVFKDWNGTVLSSKTYHWDDSVTAPADPARAADRKYFYTFAGWDKEITACDGDKVYTATYKSWQFADVSTSSWQIGPVVYACDRGLMAGKGTDENGNIKFDPNSPITREEFVQVLYNAEGKPSVDFVYNFLDVKDTWYTNAVLWAKKNDIANGTPDRNFGVGKNISRQDLALMLYKYAKLKGCSLAAEEGEINQFADGNKVADYAREAMDWAVTNGVLSGKGDAGKPISTFKLDPTGTATRAECAAMLKNFMTAFGL